MTKSFDVFLEHISSMKTEDNDLFFEAITEAFNVYFESVKKILEADEIVPDEDLKKMSDDEVSDKINKLKDELKKLEKFVAKSDIEKYEKLIYKRFVEDRKKLLDKP